MAVVPEIVIRDRVYIPIKAVDMSEVKKRYSKSVYSHENCRRCEFIHDRHSYACDECQHFKGHFITFSETVKNGKKYVSIPRAELYKLNELGIKKYKLVDKTSTGKKLNKKLKVTRNLYEYQRKCKNDMLKGDGRPNYLPHGILKAPPRSGKCVTGETLVSTERGLTPIREIFSRYHKDGEAIEKELNILTREGVEETSHFYKKTVDTTIKVTTSYGYYVRGTENHPVLVLNRHLRHVWKNLEDVEVGDVLCVQRKHAIWPETDAKVKFKFVQHENSANTVSLAKYPETITPELARLLGYLVANGSLTTANNHNSKWFSFCTTNSEIQADVRELLRKLFGIKSQFDDAATPNIKICSVTLIAYLKACGLKFTGARGKEIPKLVLRSTKASVENFLIGYLSCDSYISNGQIELCSASHTLMRQVQVLLLSFGIVSKLTKFDSWARNSNAPIVRDYYALNVLGENRDTFMQAFKLLKKVDLGNTVNVGTHDVIPHLGANLKKVFNTYHLGSGVYNLNGKRKLLKLYDARKHGVNALLDDLYRRDVDRIRLDALTMLDKKLVRRIKEVQNSNFFYDRVVDNQRIDTPVEVFDVTVPGSHSFVGNGIVVHNTLMSLATAIELGEKFLIIANQEDLLKQFIIELKQSTNVEDVDKFEGKKSYGICTKVEEFENYDICLCTYQTFLSPAGKKKLNKIRHLFSTVVIDECHRSAARCFSRVVDKFSAKNRFGITATEKRKDGMEFILNQIIGEVMTTAQSDTLKPKVYVIETKIKPPYAYKTWNGAMQFLTRSKERQRMILEYLKKDLKNGRKVVIPVMYKKQAFELVDKIKEMGYKAEAFVAGVDREDLLNRARAGKIDVVVGIRSILSTGVNVPIWSAIYTIAPISNPPNYYQETMRVCTPMEGKQQPIIRIFVDDMPMTKGCFRTCWFQTVVKHGFEFNDKHKEKAAAIINSMGSSRKYEDDDEYKVFKDVTKTSKFGVKNAKSQKKPAGWRPVGLFKR